MPFNYRTVSINLGGGVDTKTDPKMVNPGKLTLLQDCLFTNYKRLTKRNGYNAMSMNLVGGGTISSPTMVKSYRNELVCAATASGSSSISGNRLFSYSPDLEAWMDRGKYISVAVEKQSIAQMDDSNLGYNDSGVLGGTFYGTCAILNGFALYAYENAYNDSTYISVVDLTTGAQLVNNYLLLGSAINPRAILMGTSQLGVVYCAPSTGYLSLITVTISESGGLSLGTPVVLESTNSVSVYDVCTTATGFALMYANSTTVEIATYNTAGTQLNTTTITSQSNLTTFHINQDSVGNIWTYWGSGSNGSIQLKVIQYNSSLGLLYGAIDIGSATISSLSCITAISVSSSSQTVYFSTFNYTEIGDETPMQTVINTCTVTTPSTVSTITALAYNCNIYSHPATISGVNYMAVMYASYLTPTGALMDLTDGHIVAKFLPDESEYLFLVINDSVINPRRGFSVPSLLSLSSTQLYLAAGQVITLNTFSNTNSNGYASQPESAVLGTVGITFDFDNIDAYQSVVQQDTLVLNGGTLYQYDSASCTELGFTTDPEVWVYSPSSSGGVLGSGQWVYYVTYEWLDALGNLHQSAPSVGYISVFSSGTTNSVSINVPTYQFTQKTNVWIVLWRTISNGQIAYKVQAIPNNPAANTVQLTDTLLTDTELALGAQLYTQGNAILENIAPPPSMIMWINNNRVWCLDSENPETTFEYSKTASPGTGISFATGELELVIDSRFGQVTGVSPMDEKTVILKQNGAFYFIGDGANDAGTGSTITNPQVVPSDSGCSNSKSVILFPGGVLFRASNNKGIYIFSRGVQIQFFGLDVNAYSSQDVQAASYDSNRNQIRLLTSSGYSLLYDYVMQQWSVFSNHQGYSSDIAPASVGGVYTYVRTDGNIYQEDQSGTYLDNGSAISPIIQTFWIKSDQTQGFSRIRRCELLGDFQTSNGGHGIQISAAYDFGSSFSAPVPYYFSGSNGTFQYRERFDRQKCDAILLQIQEITTGASGEYVDFSDLGLEVGVKTGLNKLPGYQSVG